MPNFSGFSDGYFLFRKITEKFFTNPDFHDIVNVYAIRGAFLKRGFRRFPEGLWSFRGRRESPAGARASDFGALTAGLRRLSKGKRSKPGGPERSGAAGLPLKVGEREQRGAGAGRSFRGRRSLF